MPSVADCRIEQRYQGDADLPQVLEKDSNRSRETAQAVPVPCVIVGKADAEVSDYYKISVRAGQRLSFEVLGRRLGSAFDPQLSLLGVLLYYVIDIIESRVVHKLETSK